MSLTDAQRKQLLEPLSRDAKTEYQRLDNAIGKIKTGNPGLDARALDDYRDTMIQAFNADALNFKKTIDAAKRDGTTPDWETLKKDSVQRIADTRNQWMAERLPTFGEDGKKSWGLLDGEMNKSAASGILGNFYTKKDGVKWGGVAGGLLGGFLLLNMATGPAGPGWFAIAAAVVGALTGGWLGNKAGDMISNRLNKDKTTVVAPDAPGKAPAKEKDAATLEREERARAAVMAATESNREPEAAPPSNKDLGELPRPTVGQETGGSLKRE